MARLRTDRADVKSKRPLYQELPFLFLHVAIALVGGILAVLLIGAMFYGIGMRTPTINVIYNPLVWLPALFLGLVVNRFAQHRSAPFVAMVGLVLLVGVMLWDVAVLKRGGNYRDLTLGHYWAYEFRQMFSSNDKTCGDGECLGKLLITAPFMITVAYSIGAWLGIRFGKPEAPQDQPQNSDAPTHA